MKLSLKLIFGIGSLAVISTASVLAITSCSNANPFEGYVTGQSITVDSKKNANYLLEVVKLRNFGFKGVPGRSDSKLLFKTGAYEKDEFDSRTASDCIYGDLAAILAQNYLDNYSSKNKVSLTIDKTGDSYTNKFLGNASTDSSYSATTNVGVQIKYLTNAKTSKTFVSGSPITFAYNSTSENPPHALSVSQTDLSGEPQSYNFRNASGSD